MKMTRREANQRAAVNNCTIYGPSEDNEYEVVHNSWTRRQREKRAYFTDDLEDAALTTGTMKP